MAGYPGSGSIENELARFINCDEVMKTFVFSNSKNTM